jgi:hypothetical protein
VNAITWAAVAGADKDYTPGSILYEALKSVLNTGRLLLHDAREYEPCVPTRISGQHESPSKRFESNAKDVTQLDQGRRSAYVGVDFSAGVWS